jgi:hypothetical protein
MDLGLGVLSYTESDVSLMHSESVYAPGAGDILRDGSASFFMCLA